MPHCICSSHYDGNEESLGDALGPDQGQWPGWGCWLVRWFLISYPLSSELSKQVNDQGLRGA